MKLLANSALLSPEGVARLISMLRPTEVVTVDHGGWLVAVTLQCAESDCDGQHQVGAFPTSRINCLAPPQINVVGGRYDEGIDNRHPDLEIAAALFERCHQHADVLPAVRLLQWAITALSTT